MTDVPGADATALAAYAAHYRLDAEEAAVEWPSASEVEHKYWRVLAARQARPPSPGQAVYERHHALLRQRFPGIAPIAWDELGDEARAEWEDIARAGVAAYAEATRGDSADVRAAYLEAAGLPAYWHVRAALATAVGALQHVKLGTDVRLAAKAGNALAEVDKLTEGSPGHCPGQQLAYAEDREADENAAEDDSVSAGIGSPEDGECDNCEPTL
jgi:hypothetical protein